MPDEQDIICRIALHISGLTYYDVRSFSIDVHCTVYYSTYIYMYYNILYNYSGPRCEFLYGPVGFSMKMCGTVFTCLVTGHYVNYISLCIIYTYILLCTIFERIPARFFFCHGYFIDPSCRRVNVRI